MDPKSFLQLNITFVNDIECLFRDLGATKIKLTEIVSSIDNIATMKDELSIEVISENKDLNLYKEK